MITIFVKKNNLAKIQVIQAYLACRWRQQPKVNFEPRVRDV